MAFKVDKTMQSAEKAIKGATRKAKDDLKKVEIKAEIKIIRKTCAFPPPSLLSCPGCEVLGSG